MERKNTLEYTSMIRKFPGHDTDNPPGCVNYELPLAKSIEEYKAESRQNELTDAFERGYRVGYQQAKIDALRGLKQLDPSSELSR